ncbi:hypothetical protein DXG01_006146 [Tephrocybe rancida]|nr:hypothetical protein DXG01_006146 [Tephrocybe rancida]
MASRKPKTIQHLDKVARDKLPNITTKSFEYYVTMTKQLHAQAERCLLQGTYEDAYIQFSRAAVILGELIPQRDEFVALDEPSRYDLSFELAALINEMEKAKLTLEQRIRDWDTAHLSTTSSAQAPGS